MTDSADVKALIERVKFFAPWAERVQERPEDAWRLIHDLADALEASQQAPAVDVEALERSVHRSLKALVGRLDWAEDDTAIGGQAARIVERAVASGTLQDAAVVRAEALEAAADDWVSMTRPAGITGAWLRNRAEAIREGRA